MDEGVVDPRFARWFGRNVILHARDEENIFINRIRRDELEKWTRRKEYIKQGFRSIIVIIGVFCYNSYDLFKALLQIAFSFTSFILFYTLLSLPLITVTPFIVILCKYSTPVDICLNEDFNITYTVNNTIHVFSIEPRLLNRMHELMYETFKMTDLLTLRQASFTCSLIGIAKNKK